MKTDMETDPVTLACLKLTVTIDVVPLDRPFKTPSRTVSTGTGFFFDATPFVKGWAVDRALLERHEDRAMILTCAHVVESAVKVQVSYGATGSRDLHDAEILCVCHEKDLVLSLREGLRRGVAEGREHRRCVSRTWCVRSSVWPRVRWVERGGPWQSRLRERAGSQ